MKIKDLYDAHHFSARFRMGVDYAYTKNLLGKDTTSVLFAVVSSPIQLVDEPKLTSREEIWSLPKKTGEQRRAFGKLLRDESNGLIQWWLKQIHLANYPDRERMVLFWHNHFTSEWRKVRFPLLMY